LLVSQASVRCVSSRLLAYVSGHASLQPVQSDAAGIPASRFRPNFVVDSAQQQLQPFAEDQWSSVRIGPFTLTVQGGCNRCTMVNIDPTTATRNSALYALLHTCRKNAAGKVLFGALLSKLQVEPSAAATAAATAVAAAPQDMYTQVRWWPIAVNMPCSVPTTQ